MAYLGGKLRPWFDAEPNKRALRSMVRVGVTAAKEAAEAATPTDTGHLRENWVTTAPLPTMTFLGYAWQAEWKNDTEYACLPGDTPVTTEAGYRPIEAITEGEKVLTQTGSYRRVTATYSFPATEKPDLVTIGVADRTLTLTTDHKIMVHREGFNRWVPAGEIVFDDKVYCPVGKDTGYYRLGPAESDTHVHPTRFEERRVVSVERWKYRNPPGERMRLYDLTVEQHHSFVANGVLVSNSYVNYGTGLYGPEHRKYLILPKKPGGSLHWVDRLTGQDRFAKSVMHPGSPGHHMLEISASMLEASWVRLVRPVMNNWSREVERQNPWATVT